MKVPRVLASTSLPSLLLILLFSIVLSACGGGSKDDGDDGGGDPTTLTPPDDYESQPAYSGGLQAYKQDSDGDLISDIYDPAPGDEAVSTLTPFNELEFNNNIGEANDVANSGYPFLIQGALTRGSTYYLDGDYFKFSASQGDRISILLLVGSVNVDGNAFTLQAQPFSPRVTLISSVGAVVTSLPLGDIQSGMAGIGVEIPATGDYYIEVSDPSISVADYDYSYVLRVQLDSDFDGLSDALEMVLGSNDEAADSDGDGISDLFEVLPQIVINPGTADQGDTNWWDVDNDGIVNWWDVDSDGDGPPDRLEGRLDLDLDAIANFLDTDANNNGKNDGEEVGESFQHPVDTDRDGLDDYMDFDADDDGIPASLDADDLQPQFPGDMFEDDALSVLAVRAVIDDDISLPDQVLIGKMLWVDGENFAQNTQVLFPVPGGTLAVLPDMVDADNNQLKVTVPAQTIDGTLYLYDGAQLSNGYDIHVSNSDSEPFIYPLADRTYAGAALTLQGMNLSDSQVNVNFESNSGAITVTGQASGDSVTVTVPATASSGMVSVETGGKQSNRVSIAVIAQMSAQIQLPTGTGINCEDIHISQFGVQKNADASCTLGAIDIDNNSINFVSLFNTDGDDNVHLLLEAVLLPGQTSAVFNSLSTAIKLVYFNLGYQVSQPQQYWSGIYDSLAANTDVQALADEIATLLVNDRLAYSEFTDATLVQKYQQALISGSDDVAVYLASQASRAAAKVEATITPAASQHNVLLSTINPADINLENETRVYLSVKVTDSSGKQIGYYDSKNKFHPYAHIRHPWDKSIIAPQGWGLLLISTEKNFKVTGRDSHFDVTTGGVAAPADLSREAYKYTLGRTLFDGVAAPVMNKVLEKIIGQKLQSAEIAKVIIEVAGPSAWNNFLSDAINGPDKFFSAFNVYIAVPFNAAVGSCFQVPVGDTCKTLTLALAKHLGLTEYRVKTLIFKTVGKEIAAYLIPGVNAIKATYEVLDKINFAGSLLITGYDIGVTPGAISFDVDFPLEINEVKPMCLIRGKNEKLLLKGKGFLPYISGSLWWKKEVVPVVKLGSEEGEVKTVKPDGTSLVADFSSALSFLNNGDFSVSIEHQGQSASYAQPVKVAADGIIFDTITPASGGRGKTVTLNGCGFADVASQNAVWFSAESSGGNVEHARATVLSSSVDTLVVVVPDDAITGDVYIEANSLSSNRLPFTVESANVTITYGDNGYANDDTFSLYVDDALVSTMASPSRPFPVEVEMNAGVHTVKMVGITAPDDVGTYSISFSGNVSVLSGPSQSGSDLTAGVVKSWQVEVSASTAGRAASRQAASFELQPE
jgi:hypothetical protein